MSTRWNGRQFSVNGDYSAAQTNTELVAAEGANTRVVITSVGLNAAADCTVKLLNGSAGTVVLGTVSVNAEDSYTARFDPGIELSKNTALCVTTSYAGVHCVTVTGYVTGRPG